MKSGKRYLVIDKDSMSYSLHKDKADEIEVKCLEISPVRKLVKLRFASGHESWEIPSNYIVKEQLK